MTDLLEMYYFLVTIAVFPTSLGHFFINQADTYPKILRSKLTFEKQTVGLPLYVKKDHKNNILNFLSWNLLALILNFVFSIIFLYGLSITEYWYAYVFAIILQLVTFAISYLVFKRSANKLKTLNYNFNDELIEFDLYLKKHQKNQNYVSFTLGNNFLNRIFNFHQNRYRKKIKNLNIKKIDKVEKKSRLLKIYNDYIRAFAYATNLDYFKENYSIKIDGEKVIDIEEFKQILVDNFLSWINL